MLKKGTRVKQIVPAPIEGFVTKIVRYDVGHKDEGEPTGDYLVSWEDAEGVVHSRHFTEDQVEVLEQPKEEQVEIISATDVGELKL
jgi:hypothetical protein